MLVYNDVITGDEMISDAYDVSDLSTLCTSQSSSLARSPSRFGSRRNLHFFHRGARAPSELLGAVHGVYRV